MELKSILNKRNYQYLYYLIKHFDKSVKKRKEKYQTVPGIDSLIRELNVDRYKKIAVVASGPSSNKLKEENDVLYFSTNNSIQLMNKKHFVYVVLDKFYLIKYLKGFDPELNPNWKGSLFWFYVSKPLKESKGYNVLLKYLTKKKRDNIEVLICNDKEDVCSSDLHEEICMFLKSKFEFDFYGVNSGFVTTVLAFVLAYVSNKDLEIYGLDMGEKGGGYFNNESKEVGSSIKGDFSKDIVSAFFDKIYEQDIIEISNYSYFRTKI